MYLEPICLISRRRWLPVRSSHLHIHTQRRELTAQLRFANVLEKSVLLQVQAQLRTALQLGRVLLLPRYPADQLTVAYLPSLADTLRAAGKHINGFFDGATAELAGDISPSPWPMAAMSGSSGRTAPG